MHLASWGMHSISLQLPSAGPWIANGRTLARIVNAIHRSPELIDSRIDASRIVLVGHSFGGAAVAVALAEGAQAAGGILLDPAGIGKDLPGYLKRVSKPVMVLGADEQVFTARNRGYFHRYIPRGVVEVSIKNASHEDAQYPSAASLQLFGLDYTTTEGLQLTFVSAMTAAAFSLAVTGKFDYAWTSFGDALESGRFLNAKKK